MSEMSYLEKLLDGAEVEWKPLRKFVILKMDLHLKATYLKKLDYR